jgi:tetratricopeptide (TPR) repeat protein
LDLGPPQVAAAVARGLDFYRLLELERTADIHTIARRYRQLRAIFPDDPRRLSPEPARKLELLELAGRVLTDPNLRRTYDQLRPGTSQTALSVVRCSACAAPLEPESAFCVYCGTARPPEPQAAIPPLDASPPMADLIDYYALLGLTAEHLQPLPTPAPSMGRIDPRMNVYGGHIQHAPRPPTAQDVDAAAGKRQQAILIATSLSSEERESRLREIELARRMLRDERHRPSYDALLQDLGRGRIDRNRLEGLHQLQQTVLAEYQEEQGISLSGDQRDGMLRQALGYMDAGMPRDALALLRKVIAADPHSVAAQRAFAIAILTSDDPLALGGHMLRQVLNGMEIAQAGGQALEQGDALAALCNGLIAREEQRSAEAMAQLRQATRLAPQLGVAWRALAAISLDQGEYAATIQHAQQALSANSNDERALLLIVAACLRNRKREQAHAAAAQIARLRGPEWDAERVIHELEGSH